MLKLVSSLWVVVSTYYRFFICLRTFKVKVGDPVSTNYAALERMDGVIIKHLPSGQFVYFEKY